MKLVCLLGLGLYAALSVTDFRLTYTLIEGTGGVVFEGNPIAASWLEQYGWRGLAAYKIVTVSLFVSTCVYIASRRPRTAAVVIALGCVVLLAVTSYSRRLIEAHKTEYPGIDYVSADGYEGSHGTSLPDLTTRSDR